MHKFSVLADVSAEDFFNGNVSAVEQRAVELATAFFLEQVTASIPIDSGSRITRVAIIAPTVVVLLLLLIAGVLFVVIGSFVIYRHRSKRYMLHAS